ncbi:tryptophan-rich sensory protein [Candidatus Peregrinibacteria bacterium]|nr:tryptophan-rich sensory protein [Candidatus Peregrinibacteria bacterium]
MKFKFKSNYVIIPFVTILVAIIGSIFSQSGMMWYNTELVKPELTPPGWVFPIAWNTIFVLTTISALIVWNSGPKQKRFLLLFKKKAEDTILSLIMGLFIANAVLNVCWSLLFFTLRFTYAAFLEMIVLEATVIALIVLIYKRSKAASALLLPYAVWVAFATYLTSQVILLN